MVSPATRRPTPRLFDIPSACMCNTLEFMRYGDAYACEFEREKEKVKAEKIQYFLFSSSLPFVDPSFLSCAEVQAIH